MGEHLDRIENLMATAHDNRLDRLEDDMRLVKTKIGISYPRMPNLNNTTLARLAVLYPPLIEQSEIAAQLSAVDAKLAQEDSRRSGSGGLFQSLPHHILTGQVRLPEFAGASS